MNLTVRFIICLAVIIGGGALVVWSLGSFSAVPWWAWLISAGLIVMLVERFRHRKA